MVVIILIFLVGFSSSTHALSLLEEREGHLHYLKMAKVALIQGNTGKAKIFLGKPFFSKTPLYPIKRRYDALVAFLERDYKKSLAILEEDIFRSPRWAREICLQKMISMVLAKIEDGFQREFNSCLKLIGALSEDKVLWLNALAKKTETLRQLPRDHSLAKAQIKLALFNGREEDIVKRTATMGAELYEFQDIRELLGLVYGRMNQETMAQDFLEGIDSPSADMFRGHRALKKQDYAGAFREMKKALHKRPLSANALNRALPLAILLGKWEEGNQLAERIRGEEGDILSLKSFFP